METEEPQWAMPIKSNIDFFQQNLFAVFIIVQLIGVLWDIYLSFRQQSFMKRLEKRPEILRDIIPEDVYDKSRTYAMEKNIFDIVKMIIDTSVDIVFAIFWGTPLWWRWGSSLVESIGLNPNCEYSVTVGCFLIMIIYVELVMQLPYTVYSTFVIEQKYNFNKQSLLFFFKDQIKQMFIFNTFMVILICAVVWIIKNGGDYFFVYLWVFVIVVALLIMIIYPEFIAPLFDKYTPLPESDLRTGIEALAQRVGFPLYKLYIVEGSKRSSHSNAYLYGFFKHKRIVLFDTLIAEYAKIKEGKEKEQEESTTSSEGREEKKSAETNEGKESRGCKNDEVIAVLGHELGHWHHSHAILHFVFGQVIIFINFFLFAQMMHYKAFYEAFGFPDIQPVFIKLWLIMSYVLQPVNKLMSLGMVALSRRFEFQADQYSLKLGFAEPLKRALIKLHKDNLGYPLFDPLYSSWHHSHPPLLERLDALKKDD